MAVSIARVVRLTLLLQLMATRYFSLWNYSVEQHLELARRWWLV